MKKISLVFCFSFLFSGSILAETIKLGADIWCPFNCDPQETNQGYVIDIAKIAFEKSGDKVEYVVLPWTKAIASAKEGKLTGIIGAAKADAPNFIFGQMPIVINMECFFINANDNWKYEDIKSLADGKKIGIVKDYSYSEFLTNYFNANPSQVDAAAGEIPIETNFRKLATGKIARLFENKDVANNYLARTKRQSLFKNAGCVASDPLYVAFDPKNPNSAKYAKQFDETIRDLKRSGEYDKILAKYGLR